ncbi:transposase family protein [Pseudonocardia sp. HH130629-09]|uniref:transposase family protein n=1 Tax=Pseudonocardia sp. HH130629-09 TaxID=1641402 RepID=UPI000760D94B|nr:transposase family protein [Pseudonocardia sp. HH130629-09]
MITNRVVPALSSAPIVAVLLDPDTQLDAAVTESGSTQAALSLFDALHSVPDPRRARGVRHGLSPVLVLVACAVLAGARSSTAIAEHTRDVGVGLLVELADRLGIDPQHAVLVVPHESTIRRLLQQLDPVELESALHAWTSAQLAERPTDTGRPRREQRRVWAPDGKTVRGARTPDGQPHLLFYGDRTALN